MRCARLRVVFIAVLLPALLSACSAAKRHFWELSSPDLPHIAMVRADPIFGSVVVYNTEICKEIGAACGFFRSHAHAHTQLNHQLLPPGAYPESQERDADCWAARNADPEEVRAAVALLADRQRNAGLPITGDPAERAKTVRECAMAAGNWPGDR